MVAANVSDLVTIPLAGEFALWPIDESYQDKYDTPFLPITDEGLSEVPTAVVSLTKKLGRCAYIEAEIFGGDGIQASAVFDAGVQIDETLLSWRAINSALKSLGVVPRDGFDEFDTLGLGAERSTEAWLKNQAEQVSGGQPDTR